MTELCPISTQQYTINGKEINFRPGDPDWLDAFSTMAESLEASITPTDEEKADIEANPRAAFKYAREKDKIIREKIDSVFGPGASDAAYSGNMLTFSEGLPVWFVFLMSMAEKVEEFITGQKKQGDTRLSKYEAKFAKYRRK